MQKKKYFYVIWELMHVHKCRNLCKSESFADIADQLKQDGDDDEEDDDDSVGYADCNNP